MRSGGRREEPPSPGAQFSVNGASVIDPGGGAELVEGGRGNPMARGSPGGGEFLTVDHAPPGILLAPWKAASTPSLVVRTSTLFRYYPCIVYS